MKELDLLETEITLRDFAFLFLGGYLGIAFFEIIILTLNLGGAV